MKFEYMKEFIALSETRNYSVCADMLFISQPSLTRHIQEIERELGVPVFQRTSRGIVLTEAGEFFLPYAKQAIELQNRYLDDIAQYIERLNGTLVLGSVYAMPQYQISKIMNAWHKTHTTINTKIIEGDSTELLSWMRQGTIDYAFIREDFPDENSDFDRIHITTDQLVCLVPESSPLAKLENVTISQLQNEKFVYFENCPLIRNLFLGAGYNPSLQLTGARGRNAVIQVKEGTGIMLGFRTPIDDSELGGFSILEISPKVTSNINFIYRSKNLSETGMNFVRFIKNYLAANPDPE